KRVAATPLNVTDFVPVKATPTMTTVVPTGPLEGEKLVIEGGTLKDVLLDPDPPGVVTLILPLAPQQGTVAVICEYESTEKLVAGTLLNVTAVPRSRPTCRQGRSLARSSRRSAARGTSPC